jgi:hypothetical protein
MGVRFECPNGHQLNVKAHLSGKRGICPACGARFVVPAFSGGRVPEAPDAPSPSSMGAPGGLQDDVVWYVRPAAGGQFGPVGDGIFQQWVNEGRVAADSWVWRTGWADWRPGRDVLAGGDSSLGSVAVQAATLEATPLDADPFAEPSLPGPQRRDALPAPKPGEPMSMARRRRQQLNHRLTIILGLVAVVLIVVMAVVMSR